MLILSSACWPQNGVLTLGRTIDLLERVGAGAPPGEEHGQTDGLKDASQGADGDGVERALFGEDLGDELRKIISMSRHCVMTARDVRMEQS